MSGIKYKYCEYRVHEQGYMNIKSEYMENGDMSQIMHGSNMREYYQQPVVQWLTLANKNVKLKISSFSSCSLMQPHADSCSFHMLFYHVKLLMCW